MKTEELIREALKARENSYAPYSGYNVGAAVEAESGKVYRGCNVENASYPCGICAERTAIFKAVSEGEKTIEKIAIVGGKTGAETLDMAYPCGICRQVMREFADPKALEIIVARSETDYEVHTLEELLPNSFGPENLA